MINWLEEASRLIEQGKGFEVKVEDEEVKVDEAKPSKVKLPVKGVKKYAGRRGLSREMKNLLLKVVEGLGSSKVPFKVTIGGGEFIVRFDLDRYVRVHGEGASVVGFRSLDEHPVSTIAGLLREHGEVKLLSLVR